MTQPLFSDYSLSATIDNHKRGLAKEIYTLGENEVLNTPHEEMVRYLVEKWQIDPLAIDELGIRVDYGDAQIDVSKDYRYGSFGLGPQHVTGTKVTFYVPFTGDPDLLKCQPSARSLSLPRATIRPNEIVFEFNATTDQTSGIKARFDRDLEQTRIHADRVTAEVKALNAALPGIARDRLTARRDKLLQDRKLAETMGFPLKRTQDPPSTLVTPEVRRRVTPQKPRPSAEPFSPDPTLDMAEYEHIINILSNMVMVMERSPKTFGSMTEEDLRTHFLVHLNGHYEGQATGETFNYEGKTDILVRASGRNIFIAECKFWRGPAGLTDALDQLLGYTSWRDTKTSLLVFNRDVSMSTVVRRIPGTVAQHPNFKRKLQYNSETGFRYVFSHRDDVSRDIIITVLVFDVPAGQ